MYIKNNKGLAHRSLGSRLTADATTKGFTLIELLVVISIIGLLSSIILASLNSARAKGGDAGVKANLASLKSQAEILYDQYGCYGSNNGAVVPNCTSTPAVYSSTGPIACPTFFFPGSTLRVFMNPITKSQIAAAKIAGGDGFTSCASTVAGTAYAVAVQLNSKTEAWCVDSTGASRQVGSITDQPSLNNKILGGVCSAS